MVTNKLIRTLFAVSTFIELTDDRLGIDPKRYLLYLNRFEQLRRFSLGELGRLLLRLSLFLLGFFSFLIGGLGGGRLCL